MRLKRCFISACHMHLLKEIIQLGLINTTKDVYISTVNEIRPCEMTNYKPWNINDAPRMSNYQLVA